MSANTDDAAFEKLQDDVLRGLEPGDSMLLQTIRSGIQLEEFVHSPAGRILITESIKSMRVNWLALLDPSCNPAREREMLSELRVVYGALRMLASSFRAASQAEQTFRRDDVDEAE